jgi:hypothetical protein
MVLLLREFYRFWRIRASEYYEITITIVRGKGHLLFTKETLSSVRARTHWVFCTDKHHHSNYAQSADEV